MAAAARETGGDRERDAERGRAHRAGGRQQQQQNDEEEEAERVSQQATLISSRDREEAEGGPQGSDGWEERMAASTVTASIASAQWAWRMS